MNDIAISVADSQGYSPEELLVQFSSPQTDEKIAKKVENLYGKDSKKVHKIALDYSDLGLSNTYLLKLSNGEDPKEAKEKYKKDPEVIYAELNYIVTVAELFPNDPYFSTQWGLSNIYDTDIDAPEVWDTCTGSQNVIVAVIDTGVDYNHPDLVANKWTNLGEIPGNSIDDDNNGYIDDFLGWDFNNKDNDPWDDNGHGTHCAGIIGAVGNNGQGVTGMMWQVKIMPLKFANEGGMGYTSDAVSAILYANAKKADIISNSWGVGTESITLKNAIDNSSAVVVCAAGNGPENIDISPFYPASYSSPQIIAVAASNADDNLASFSNYGSVSVDVAAPGDYIYSTLPDNNYGYKNGTSMATPYVAGLAGLLKAYYPELSYGEVKTAIINGVDKKTSLSGKVASSGRINANKSFDLSVTIVTPNSAPNTGPVSITVSGIGFKDTPVLKLAGSSDIAAKGVTFISSTKLTCSFDLNGKDVGFYDLVITNPDSTTFVSKSCFEILLPPPPIITTISPSSVGTNGSEFTLEVTGSGFTTNSKILWNGNECQNPTIFLDTTKISTLIPSSYIVNSGTALITVSDPKGISNAITFTISNLPAPTVSKIHKSSGKRGTTENYTISGSNFIAEASAKLVQSDVQSGFIVECEGEVVQDAGEITCRIEIPSDVPKGKWDIVVTNPDGKSGVKLRAFNIN
jgi:subtilisin family serine protease